MAQSILLVGGHSVEQYQGNYYTVHNYADHVHALADFVGRVDFLAAVRKTQSEPGGMQIDSNRVRVHSNQLVLGRKTVNAWTSHQQQLTALANHAVGVVESFPAAGGMFSSLYRRKRPVRIVYLKTDFRERIKYRLDRNEGARITDSMRKYYFGWSQDYAAARADAVLVRGGKLFSQYSGKVKRIEQSRPIASFDKTHSFERADSCLSETVRLLFVGNLSKRKNIPGLCAAVAAVQQRFGTEKTLQLTLVGGEHHTGEATSINEIMDHAKRLGIGDQVKCVGRIDDKEMLAGYFERADIFVLASWVEGFPRVINEALLYSLPVVSTDVGGISADLQDRKEILLVPPGDVDAFADGIYQVISSAALRQGLIRNGFWWAQLCMAEPAWRQQARLLGLL